MKLITRCWLLGSCLAMLGRLSAATVTVQALDTTTNADWRRATAVKPSDPDSDNMYGTDGFVLFNWSGANWSWVARNTASDLRRLPSYVASVTDDFANMYRNDSVYGQMNDPDQPASNKPGTVISGKIWDFNVITIQRQDPNVAFSVTVFTSYDLFNHQIWVYSGNSADAVRGDLQVTSHTTRYRTFNVGAGADPVVIRVYSQGNNISGIAFDHYSSTATSAVLQDFNSISGNLGELRTQSSGVTTTLPTLVTDRYASAPKAGRIAFSTGPQTATTGQVEFYAAPVVIPTQCTAFNWQCLAPIGFTYSIEVEDTSTWTHHRSPRWTQVLGGEWQMVQVNLAEFTPPLTAGMTVANIYVNVHGSLEGGRVATTAEALFDDFRFDLPIRDGRLNSSDELTGIHQGVPLK